MRTGQTVALVALGAAGAGLVNADVARPSFKVRLESQQEKEGGRAVQPRRDGHRTRTLTLLYLPSSLPVFLHCLLASLQPSTDRTSVHRLS